MKRALPILVGLATGAVAALIGWQLASGDIGKAGDWRNGAGRFIGMMGALGLGLGYFVTLRLTRGPSYTRDGFTLSYRPLEPVAAGYRELRELVLADLVERLRAVGYAPALEACDDTGQRVGPGDASVPLVGANVALCDPGVRGWVRIHLPAPGAGLARAMGLVEIWSEGGESTEELALFALRALGELVGSLAAKRESSSLGDDPIATVTAGIGERPVHLRQHARDRAG